MRKLITITSIVVILLAISFIGSWYSQSQVDTSQVSLNTKPEKKAEFNNARSLAIPEHLEFAGEKVPLHDPDVRERLDRELHINTYWHTNTILMIKRASRWLPMIAEELEKDSIPDDFKYIVAIETNFKNDTSPRGAVGFWQFVKDAAIEKGLEVTSEVDERYDPVKSTRAAADYLRHAHEKFGSWTMAAASYNRGITGMINAIEHQKERDYYKLMLNEETSRYIFRILAAKLVLTNPEKYGYTIQPEHLYQPFDTHGIEITETIPSLVDWSQQHNISFRQLKRYNPWLQSDQLMVRSGKTYIIQLPNR